MHAITGASGYCAWKTWTRHGKSAVQRMIYCARWKHLACTGMVPLPGKVNVSHYYEDALASLERAGHTYGCACTRKEIADSSMKSGAGGVYSGTCRSGIPQGRKARSIRVQVHDTDISVRDRLQGTLRQQLGRDVGDFIIRRADQLFAYQLAVVVDDAGQGISHVVRGTDLFDSTPRQIHLQQLLGYPQPSYLHIPVAVDSKNDKLSKQTHAPPVNPDDWSTVLCDVLTFLNQPLPGSVEDASKAELWQWAIEHWNTDSLPVSRSIAAAPGYIG